MKVSFHPSTINDGKRFVPPPIPLIRPEAGTIKKTECLTLKLRSDPAVADSQTYELTVKFFSTGTPEEWLIFRRDLARVLTGQNITSGPAKYAMARRLLLGDTLATFNKAAQEKGAETDVNFESVLDSVTTHVFPQRALAYQKRYMRRYMRKPRDMTTREFSARLMEMNSYLKEFPPFDLDQELAMEELIDILEFGVPNSWQKNMVLQGFDPLIHTPSEFVAFCERHEFTEGNLDNSENKKVNPKTSSRSSGNNGISRVKTSVGGNNNNNSPTNSNKRKRDTKWCDLHQTNGHDTHECKVVQAQIQKMRQSWESINNSKPSNFKPNSFKKDSGHNKDMKNKELMSLVKEGIKSYIKKKKAKSEQSFNVEQDHQTDEASDFDIEDFKALDVSDSDCDDSNE
jgi:hypothetical protein